MRISYVSIFPEIFVSFLATSLLAKGLDRGHITVEIVNPRDFTHDPHRQVDDVPYG
jgi:tRNA (guanine37-N1)-methyltransferase